MNTKTSLLFFIASICITQAFYVSPPCGCSPAPAPPSSPCSCQSSAVAPAPQVIYLPSVPSQPPCAPAPPPPPPCTPAPPPPPPPPCTPAPPPPSQPCGPPPKIIIATPITLPIACAPAPPPPPPPPPPPAPCAPAPPPCAPAPPPPCAPAPIPCAPAPLPLPLPKPCGCGVPLKLEPFDKFDKFDKFEKFDKLGCGKEKCTVFDEEALFRGPPCKCNCHNPVQAPNDSGDVYMRKVPIPKIPADPVSVAIALRAAQRTYVPEGQLEYGFKKRPIDLVRPKVWRNIPEEKLYSINSKVIEFKKPCDCEEDEFKVDDSEEEDDSTFAQRDESRMSSDSPCFAYSDIGYSAMGSCDQKFQNIPISTTPNPCDVPLCESELTGRIIQLPEPTEEEQLADYLNEHIRKYCAPCELT